MLLRSPASQAKSSMTFVCGPLPSFVPVLIWLYVIRSCPPVVVANIFHCDPEFARSEWVAGSLEDIRLLLALALLAGEDSLPPLELLVWRIATRSLRRPRITSHDWSLLFSRRQALHAAAVTLLPRLAMHSMADSDRQPLLAAPSTPPRQAAASSSSARASRVRK